MSRIPAHDEDDLNPAGQRVLAVLRTAHNDGLVFGGDPSRVDPDGWAKSTFPEVARRIAADTHRDTHGPGGESREE